MFSQAPSMPYYAKIGQVEMFTGVTPPSKWKICDGSVIDRTTYIDLFGVLGTAYGGGNGETTFAIPDFQGRSPVGVGESEATGHTAHTLGQYDGEETHVLLSGELAAHIHGVPYNNAAIPVGGGTDGNSRIIKLDSANRSYVNSNANGSNTPHNTMHPYAGINFIIYTGVEEAS